MSKILTVFYSRKGTNHFPDGIRFVEKGNTAYAAEYIHKAVGGDLFEIDTAKPYSEDYKTCCSEAYAELKANARPEIKGFVEDISAYDSIFVCYPNWCGTFPMCVLTFLEHYDLSGKRLIPLCTNEGSGLGHSEKDLKEAFPTAEVLPGLSVRGHQCADSEELIADWAKKQL